LKDLLCQIAQYLGDYWSSCSQLRSQLLLLKVKYPVSIEIMPSETLGFRAKAAVIFAKSKAKVTISFAFEDDTFALWPLKIPSVKCQVEIIYGTVE
jgi:kinetochore protein Spc7/SPC105